MQLSYSFCTVVSDSVIDLAAIYAAVERATTTPAAATSYNDLDDRYLDASDISILSSHSHPIALPAILYECSSNNWLMRYSQLLSLYVS